MKLTQKLKANNICKGVGTVNNNCRCAFSWINYLTSDESESRYKYVMAQFKKSLGIKCIIVWNDNPDHSKDYIAATLNVFFDKMGYF